jgi:hypothetical protein
LIETADLSASADHRRTAAFDRTADSQYSDPFSSSVCISLTGELTESYDLIGSADLNNTADLGASADG